MWIYAFISLDENAPVQYFSAHRLISSILAPFIHVPNYPAHGNWNDTSIFLFVRAVVSTGGRILVDFA